MGERRDKGELADPRTARLMLACVLGGLSLLSTGCGSQEDASAVRVEVLVTATAFTARPWRVSTGADDDGAREIVFVVTDRGKLVTPFTVRGLDGKERRVEIYPGKTSTLRASLRAGAYELNALYYGTAQPIHFRVGPPPASG